MFAVLIIPSASLSRYNVHMLLPSLCTYLASQVTRRALRVGLCVRALYAKHLIVCCVCVCVRVSYRYLFLSLRRGELLMASVYCVRFLSRQPDQPAKHVTFRISVFVLTSL